MNLKRGNLIKAIKKLNGAVNGKFGLMTEVSRLCMTLFSDFSWSVKPAKLLDGLNAKHELDEIKLAIERVEAFDRILQRISVSTSCFRITSTNVDETMLEDLNSLSLLSDLHSQIWQDLNTLSIFCGDVSNTLIWRHRDVDGRRISVVNYHLVKGKQIEIKAKIGHIDSVFTHLYEELFLHKLNTVVFGFVAGKSAAGNAKFHAKNNPEAMINCDIAKFFDSVTLSKIFQHNLFFDGLRDAVYTYAAEAPQYSLETEEEFDTYLVSLSEAFIRAENFLFIFMMHFMTHNGRIPTGAAYSPVVANIIFRMIDKKIISMAYKKSVESESRILYTRYADDITLSANKQKDADGNNILTIDTVKEIENILNGYGFYLKYAKTKISGKRDKKEVTGVNISSKVELKLAHEVHSRTGSKTVPAGYVTRCDATMSSDEKYELAMRLATCTEISSSDQGKLAWLRSINRRQYAYCMAHYYVGHLEEFVDRHVDYKQENASMVYNIAALNPAFHSQIKTYKPSDITIRDIHMREPNVYVISVKFAFNGMNLVVNKKQLLNFIRGHQEACYMVKAATRKYRSNQYLKRKMFRAMARTAQGLPPPSATVITNGYGNFTVQPENMSQLEQDYMRDKIKESLDKYIGKVTDPYIIERIKNDVAKVVRDIENNRDNHNPQDWARLNSWARGIDDYVKISEAYRPYNWQKEYEASYGYPKFKGFREEPNQMRDMLNARQQQAELRRQVLKDQLGHGAIRPRGI